MQTAAEMCDLTLPWHHRRCCCSQLCTGIALMCEGEQKVIWLEVIYGVFSWSFWQSSPLISFAWEYMNESGNARSPGQSTSWGRGVGSNHLFQQQLWLKLSQNNHVITVMPTLLWYLLCGVWSTSTGLSFLAGHLPGTDGKNQQSPLPSSRLLICGMQSSCGMPQPRCCYCL